MARQLSRGMCQRRPGDRSGDDSAVPFPPESDYWLQRGHTATVWSFSRYLPNSIFTTPSIRVDDQSFHSTLATSLIPGWTPTLPASIAQGPALGDLNRRLRPLLVRGWISAHRLFPHDNHWLAMQFDRPDLNEAPTPMIQPHNRDRKPTDLASPTHSGGHVSCKGKSPAARTRHGQGAGEELDLTFPKVRVANELCTRRRATWASIHGVEAGVFLFGNLTSALLPAHIYVWRRSRLVHFHRTRTPILVFIGSWLTRGEARRSWTMPPAGKMNTLNQASVYSSSDRLLRRKSHPGRPAIYIAAMAHLGSSPDDSRDNGLELSRYASSCGARRESPASPETLSVPLGRIRIHYQFRSAEGTRYPAAGVDRPPGLCLRYRSGCVFRRNGSSPAAPELEAAACGLFAVHLVRESKVLCSEIFRSAIIRFEPDRLGRGRRLWRHLVPPHLEEKEYTDVVEWTIAIRRILCSVTGVLHRGAHSQRPDGCFRCLALTRFVVCLVSVQPPGR